MSGGHFDYKDSTLKAEIFGWGIETVEQAIRQNPLEDKEFSAMVYEMLDVLHDFDWYISGDTSKKHYRDSLQAFKNKWLKTDSKERLQYIINTEVNTIKQELYDTFSITTKEERG